MNIFFPEASCAESVKCLDDKRLNKQILECYQIYQVGLGMSEGYANHPIVKHYILYPKLVCTYGYEACKEYKYRFNKKHKYHEYFKDAYKGYLDIEEESVLFCAEGSKNSPSCIRTTELDEVLRLYKQKLINKWNEDTKKGRSPKWTNRGEPKWYKHLPINPIAKHYFAKLDYEYSKESNNE